MRTKNNIVIDLPIVLSSNKAAQAAEQALYNGWLERERYEFTLPIKYIYLDPGDVVSMTVDGISYTIRLNQVRISLAEMKVYCLGVAADQAVFDPNAVGGDAPAGSLSVGGYVSTIVEYIDCAPLRQADDAPGFYIATGGLLSGWSASTIYKSADGGSSYASILDTFAQSVMGQSTTALADVANPEIWDTTNSLTVRVLTAGGSLSSDTEINVLNGANLAILGNELIQWKTAVDNGDGTYTLSKLLRGRFGTEWATDEHTTSGERFVVLSSTTTYRKTDEPSDINAAYMFKAVSIGGYLQNAVPETFTNTGLSLKPFSPVQLDESWSGNNVTVTWVRRDRIAGLMLWSPSNSEDTEEYEVDIYDSSVSPAVFLRTKTITSATTLTYTDAEQQVDASPASRDYTFYIYQMSATVGRGHVASIRSVQ